MPKHPRTGPMRHRVELFDVVYSDDPVGGGVQKRTEVSQGTVWSNVVPRSGNEQLNSLALDRPLTTNITVKDQASKTFLDVKQISFGSRQLRVEAASNPDERGRYILYECSEGGQLY